MKIKAVLGSLFLSYMLSGIFLLLLAFLVFRLNLGTALVTSAVMAVYVLSCMAGGFLTGKKIRQDKYRWGCLTGLCYFGLLMVVSVILGGKENMTLIHTLTILCMCVGGGTLGGMFA